MAATAQSGIPDPVRAGVIAGWKVVDASRLERDLELEADVVIVGTGAGGGVAAETLAAAGLTVVLVEEGALRTSSDFRMRESEAYPELYQESAARKTRDKAINILQGRCVGGGTTVNWTSSFRTPETTLRYWAAKFGLAGFGVAELAPWFERIESRLSIAPWMVPPNANNATLAQGAKAIGIAAGSIRRNVLGCWNLGYCGMGCPTNAKQSMLVTTIPSALDKGATLVTRARAVEFRLERDRVVALACAAMDADGVRPRSAPGHLARARLRRGGGCDRHAGVASAQPGARPARARRQAHVPAPGGGVGGADAGEDRGLLRRAADRLLGPLPRHAAAGRSDGLQARGAADPPDPGGDHAAQPRRGATPAG